MVGCEAGGRGGVIVAFYDHGGKGAPFAEALRAAGHEIVDAYGPRAARADVAVLDSDHHVDVCDTVGRVVLYPHGGNVIARWDGQPVHPAVRAVMVPAVGHAQAMALYGLPVPAVPVGWPWCPLRPACPTGKPAGRVVFGPSHPLANGRIDERTVALNRSILDELGALPDVGVDVRSWEQGRRLSYSDLDDADVVVADGTLLALAVARGVPAVTFGQDIAPDLAHDGPVRPAATWESWRRRTRFPADVADGPLADVIAMARADDATQRAVAAWREAFVGGPLDDELVVGLVERAAA